MMSMTSVSVLHRGSNVASSIQQFITLILLQSSEPSLYQPSPYMTSFTITLQIMRVFKQLYSKNHGHTTLKHQHYIPSNTGLPYPNIQASRNPEVVSTLPQSIRPIPKHQALFSPLLAPKGSKSDTAPYDQIPSQQQQSSHPQSRTYLVIICSQIIYPPLPTTSSLTWISLPSILQY